MARKQFCQSCGMPVDGKDNGTEKDGSLSWKYCSLCYKEGRFIDPDMSLDQMKHIVDEALKGQGWGRIRRYLAISTIPRLDRWKKA